jgi:hypothetical protein
MAKGRGSILAVSKAIGEAHPSFGKEQVSEIKARLTSATEREHGLINGLNKALFRSVVAELPQMPEKQPIRRPEAGKGR